MSRFDALLALQDLDTSIEQLEHRLAGLPERAQIAEGERLAESLAANRAEVQGRRDDIQRVQKRLEDEVAMIEAKVVAENDKLYGGGVTSPKDAQALTDEIASLKRHQEHLEDQVIEQMEAAEPVDAELASSDGSIAEVAARLDALRAALGEQEGEINAELATVQTERESALGGVDEELVAKYQRMRPRHDAATVVVFDGKVGCPLHSSSMELDRCKKADSDSLLECPECGRLIVIP